MLSFTQDTKFTICTVEMNTELAKWIPSFKNIWQTKLQSTALELLLLIA